MKFAQLSAASQFEDLGVKTETQIDYLKQIEINTRTQIDVLVQAMNSLGGNINSSLLELISKFNSDSNTNITGGDSLINSVYQSVLGRTAETSGASYWQNALDTGTVSSGTLGQSVIAGAVSSGELTREQAISQLYVGGLGRAPDQAGLDYWVNSGIPVSDLPAILAQSASANGEQYQQFYNGGYTGNIGVHDIAGIVHGQEFVANAPTTKALGLNQNNGGLFVDMLNQMKIQSDIINSMKQEQQYYLKDIENNTRGSRFVGA